ncbi:SRPBCC family protein [Streptomyces sp. NPDC012389]|uniref:SRPBCC family protein n=1 Tax=unclassified Streptomyces TaxID=2593676 RepID=UPI00081F3857|nr:MULTISPECIES: SRPBCC family protein [unclassified Streptomyces]MYR98492.1 SRPBCC family protein [Streptomyces sp. SID4937]MYX12273.1 SRPBCC family protein [Streptomyces sp. SID8374]SCE38967.1 Polyketide cyclase / dehydrase and lipid transport [Streptomyces sp. ScaeMP-e83]
MAVRHHLIDRPPAAVWAVLEDGYRYGDWVVGTSDSRPEQGDWPETGSSITYHVHVGPKRFEGRTVVRHIDRPGTLELEAEGGPWGTARIAFDIRPWGGRTLVIVDEHPLRGLGGTLHNPLLDTLLQLRHRTMLARLARLVERVTAAEPDGGPRVAAPAD